MRKKRVVITGIIISALSFLGMIILMLLGKIIPDFLFNVFIICVALSIVFSFFRRREFVNKETNEKM